MNDAIYLDSDLKPIAYAWPGGYQMFYLARQGCRDGETLVLDFNPHDKEEFVLCPKCAGRAAEEDLILIASDVNWESEMWCEVCSEQIPSAYGEDA